MRSNVLTDCPSGGILRQYVSAELSDQDADMIDQHVDRCVNCQRAVQDLLDGGTEDIPGQHSVEQRSLQRLLQTCAADLFGALPDFVGRYRVLRELGRGAYGIVYQAHDQILDRHVAIKVPFQSVIRETGGKENYLKEARTLAGLEHPHIVRIYEASAGDDDVCYLVSQFVAGRSLAVELRERRYRPVEAARLVATLADALQHAHDRGIWHRDVKPANILLDETGHGYLADFGLALRESEIGSGPRFAGTPAYMSPEQARGAGHQVDGRTDVYSLGVVFYKLLTGQRPFLADKIEELLQLTANVEAPSVRQKDRSIPGELETICCKALALERSARYSTAGDMADDLNTWLRKQVSRRNLLEAAQPEKPIPGNSHQSTDDSIRETRAKIGGFELLSKLGRGGMGVVYRAWQPSAEREVALKCLSLTDESAQARFANEIRALGKVIHPNLVRVYSSGVDDDRFYFVMELIDGTGFRQLLNQLPERSILTDDTWRNAVCTATMHSSDEVGRYSTSSDWSNWLSDGKDPQKTAVPTASQAHKCVEYVRRIVAIVRDIAHAASALHDKGIIHRDIKPDNIMLTRDGERAVLMDLGVAKLTDSDDRSVTHTRQFVGSVRYASPEQIIDSGQVDCRTDIYSLGATLWELLTLQPIYGIDNSLSDSRAMLKIEIEDPCPAQHFNGAVSADLDAVLQKCLEKNAANRYQTATELAQDLDRWLNDQPVHARPVTAVARLFRRIRRRPLIPLLVLMIVTLALAFLDALLPPESLLPNEMRIGIKPWVGFSPLVVAEKLRLCGETDLKLIPVSTTRDTRLKVVSGEIDVAPYLMDSHTLAQAERTPTKVILQLDVSLTADAVMAGNEIRSFADLKGKKIAYMHQEAPHFLLLALCEKYGLNTDDFQHLKTETAKDAVELFVAGTADAVVSYEPFLRSARQRPDAFLVASAADDPGSIIDILTVRDDYLKKHPERVTALLRAWLEGLELLRKGDPEALRTACEFLGSKDHPISVKEYDEMVAGMRFGGREENLAFFSRQAGGTSEYTSRYHAAQRRWDRHHQLSRRTDPNDSDRSDMMRKVFGK